MFGRVSQVIVGALLLLLFLWPAAAVAAVGYFAPSGVQADFAGEVDFAIISFDPTRLRQDLSVAASHGMKVQVSLVGLSQRRPSSMLPMAYIGPDGLPATKRLAPAETYKVYDVRPDQDVIALTRMFTQIAADFPGVVNTVFLVDEPYLNGVSRSEMERLGAIVRAELDAAGLNDIRLGVIHASAMFNGPFAEMTNAAAYNYVEAVDGYIAAVETNIAALPTGPQRDEEQAKHEAWLGIIGKSRLATYDQAGSLYIGGGIPKGFDIVGFDFYLSTVLMDGVYDNAVAWLAQATQTPSCDGFERVRMSAFRTTLSFWQDGQPINGDALRATDKERLDRLFDCRMEATLELLHGEIAASGRSVQVMVLTESSANGVLEYDRAGNIEAEQPEQLLKSRVVDEVERALRLYAKGAADELVFFTFDDEFDKSIDLQIYGVSKIESARHLISAAADRFKR